MAKFSVLVSALENEKSKYNSYKGELSSYSSKINSAKNVLPILGDTAVQLKNALAKSKENVNTLSDNAHNLSQTLEQICLLYINVEKNSNNSSDNNYVVSKSENNPFSKFFPPFTNNLFYTGLLELIRKIFKGKIVESYEIDSILYDDFRSDYYIYNGEKYTMGYGGMQHGPMYSSKEQKDKIREIVLKNLPSDASFSDEGFENYLKKLNSEGCEYTALANTILTYYVGKEDKFYKDFGYSMFNEETGDLNYNLVIADLYSSIDNRKNGKYQKYRDYDSKLEGNKETYSPWNDSTGYGTNINMSKNELKRFMSEHNINTDVNILGNKKINAEKLKEFTDKGECVIISRQGGSLYDENRNIYQSLYDASGNEEGHAMVITGITDDGYYIVSSWGKKLYLKFDEGSSSQIYTVKYSEK